MFLAEALTAAYGRTLSRRKGLTLEYTPKSHLRDDSVLGYSAVPGARVRAIRKRFGATLYDVTYTISDQGARVTRGNPAGETWLFMGCSFTFGEGVSDDETLPAQFSEQLLLYLPDDINVPALPLAVPRQLSEHQKATLDLLVRRKLSLE